MTTPTPAPRAIAGPLLLAVVFLTIIGASAGIFLGLRAADSTGDGGDGGTGQGSPGVGQSQNQTPGVDQSTGNGGGEPSDPATDPAGRPCPKVSEDAARLAGSPGGLATVLYVRTAYSQVWICRDSGGGLWYQGNRHNGKPTSDLAAATSNDTLFVGQVSRVDAGYVASNQGRGGVTNYRVSTTRLVIDNPGEGSDSFEDALSEFTYRAP